MIGGKTLEMHFQVSEPIRDRREYQYRIESTDTKAASISISLDPGISGVSVSVSVSIQRPEHFLEGLGRILIK